MNKQILIGLMVLVLLVPSVSGFSLNDYNYQRTITITNNNQTENLVDGYTFNFTFDMATLVSDNKMQADANDLTVVWYNSSSLGRVELNRTNLTALNSATTTIAFALQENITAGATDTNYTMYYGNRTIVSTPPSFLDGIFYANYNFTSDLEGWSTATGSGSIAYNQSTMFMFSDADTPIFADPPLDEIPHNFMAVYDINVTSTFTPPTQQQGVFVYGWNDAFVGGFVDDGYTSLMSESDDILNLWEYINGNNVGIKNQTDFVINQNIWYRNRLRRFNNNTELNFWDRSGAETGINLTLPNMQNVYGNYWTFYARRGSFHIDNVRIMHYLEPVPSISLGSETNISAIDIVLPENITYYDTNVSLNVTNSSGAMDTWIYNVNGTTNVTFTPNTTIFVPGGEHNITVYANRTSDGTWVSDTVYFTVVSMGVNISVHGNTTGIINGWTVTATNGTNNATFASQNTPTIIDYRDLPSGFNNFTVNDGSSSLYFLNQTLNATINATALVQMTFNLSEKASNEMTITFDPSNSVGINTQVTTTCTAAEGTPGLTRNSISVSNPDVFSGGVGAYEYNCSISVETSNYRPASTTDTLNVISNISACTTYDLFAFTYTVTGLTTNQTTFNFTGPVNSYLVKTDLSDVRTTTDGVNLSRNTTDGYWITANHTDITSLVLEFGNVQGNYSHPYINLSDNILQVSSYTESHPYYTFTVFDEITQAEVLPPSIENLTIRIECLQGSSIVPFNTTRFLIPTNTQASEGVINVRYNATEYIRSYLLGADVVAQNVYLVDATQYTLYQIPIEMLDSLYFNEPIYIYKNLVGGETVITEGNFDAEHIFNSYLVKDERYILRIITDTQTIDLGFLYAIEAGTQQISIAQISLNPSISLIDDNLVLSAVIDNSTSTLRITYEDFLAQTNSIRIRVYEDTNQTPLFDNTYLNNNNLSITINNINTSLRYSVRATIDHETFGNSPVEFVVGVGTFGFLGSLGTTTAAWIYQAISLVLMIIVAGVITPRVRFGGLLLMLALIAILYYLQWFTATAGAVALLIVFVILSIAYEVRRSGLT